MWIVLHGWTPENLYQNVAFSHHKFLWWKNKVCHLLSQSNIKSLLWFFTLYITHRILFFRSVLILIAHLNGKSLNSTSKMKYSFHTKCSLPYIKCINFHFRNHFVFPFTCMKFYSKKRAKRLNENKEKNQFCKLGKSIFY